MSGGPGVLWSDLRLGFSRAADTRCLAQDLEEPVVPCVLRCKPLDERLAVLARSEPALVSVDMRAAPVARQVVWFGSEGMVLDKNSTPVQRIPAGGRFGGKCTYCPAYLPLETGGCRRSRFPPDHHFTFRHHPRASVQDTQAAEIPRIPGLNHPRSSDVVRWRHDSNVSL